MSAESDSPVNYVRWARDTATPRRLPRAQRVVLLQLASRADRRGRCHPSIDRLATDAGYSVGATKRALSGLEKRRLIRSHRRGRMSSVRQLCPDAPMPAPPCPRGTQPLFDCDLQPVDAPIARALEATTVAVAQPPLEVSSAKLEVSPTSHRSTQDEGTEEGTRAARAATDDPPAPTPPSRVLQEHLDEVLGILEAAPGLLTEPLAVDSALAAYPEAAGHDHIRAAHTVASWAFEANGVRVGTSNRLLMAALRKQTSAPGAPAGGRHELRSRRVAPPPRPRKPWDGALTEVVEQIKLRDAERFRARAAAEGRT